MGRPEDFAHFVAVHGDDLAQRAFAFTGDEGRGEALLRDALERLYADWDELGPGRRLGATHELLAQRLGRHTSDEGGAETNAGQAPKEHDRPAYGQDAASLPLWELLSTLPPRQRAAVVERHLDDEPAPPAYRLAHAQLVAAVRDDPALAQSLDAEMSKQIKVAVREVRYPVGLAADVIAEAERRQRRTILLAAALLVTVLVLVGLALLPNISR